MSTKEKVYSETPVPLPWIDLDDLFNDPEEVVATDDVFDQLVQRQADEYNGNLNSPCQEATALIAQWSIDLKIDCLPKWYAAVTRHQQFELVVIEHDPSDASTPTIAKMNDAELLGRDHPDMQDLLHKPFTFMSGNMYGQKDRRNTQDGDWVRTEMSLLAWMLGQDKGKNSWGLTRHPVSKSKEGASLVLASAIDGARKDGAIETMYCIGLDIDSGTALSDVIAKLEELGLFSIVYTSFSHGKSTLELKHDDIMRKLKLEESPDRAQVQMYLRNHHKDRYDEDFIEAIEIEEVRKQTPDGLRVVLMTPPLDKFRVILPLWEPVNLSELATTVTGWKEVWADAVTGVAVNLLGINFDATSCDVNRLFFTPRHPEEADDWYCCVVQGRPLRFEDIQPFSKIAYLKSRELGDPFAIGAGQAEQHAQLVTAAGKNLSRWHSQHKESWLAADVLETECPDKVRVAGGEKVGTVHIECPFEDQHSTEGGTATIVMNPDANSEYGYWSISCQHNACRGRNKLEFLKRMVDDEWFSETVLTDEEWNLGAPDDDKSVIFQGFEDPRDYLPSSYVRGKDMMYFQSKGDDGEDINIPVCGLFDLRGRTMNATGTGEAGRVISFVSEGGKRVEMTISRAELYARPLNVWEQLADAGLPLAGRDKKTQDRVLNLFAEMEPQQQITTLQTPGMIQDDNGEIVGFMQPTGRAQMNGAGCYRLHEDSTVPDTNAKGTLEAFKTAANAALSHVEGNPYWTLSVCAAFAGPLLGVLGWNPLGFNFSGPTSKGKSLGQMLNSAAWGNPSDGKSTFWGANGTPNAWEDLAVFGSGTSLCVDELGAMQDKRVLAPLMFALHSGRGKARKRGNGAGLTKTAEFRPFVLFSSESSIKGEVEAAGVPYRGGMAVRFPDVDVSEGHDRTPQELEEIEACKRNYGHAGPVFIEYIFESGVCDDAHKLEKEVEEIVAKLAYGEKPGLRRAARPFALAQRAGELACAAGLLDDVDAVRRGVNLCWRIFLKSDEAATANGNEALMDGFVSWVNSQLDVTIIPASGRDGDTPSNSDGRGRVIGWYTDAKIILDWKAIEAMDIPNTYGKRSALTKALDEINALDRSSASNIPYTSLPSEVGALPDGGTKRLKNLRLWRKELGI